MAGNDGLARSSADSVADAPARSGAGSAADAPARQQLAGALAQAGPNTTRILLYLLVVIFTGAAAGELGGWASQLFAFLLAVPLLSAALTIGTRVSLRFRQEFSTEHPQKGRPFGWSLKIESPLLPFSAPLAFWCYSLPGEPASAGSGLLQTLRRGEVFSRSATFVCRYRGVYPVGLAGVEVRDPLFGWKLVVRPLAQNFYVAPQVYALADGGGKRAGRFSASRSPAGLPLRSDSAADFLGLRDFQAGESPSRIHWPSSARSGKLLVREFEGQNSRSILLVLDTRGWDGADYYVSAGGNEGADYSGRAGGRAGATARTNYSPNAGEKARADYGTYARTNFAATAGDKAHADYNANVGPNHNANARDNHSEKSAGPLAGPIAQTASARTGAEDCAVEAFFSLLFAFREAAVPAKFLVPGWDAAVQMGRAELLRRSTGIFFRGDFGLGDIVASAVASPDYSEVLVISPHADPAVFDCARLLSGARQGRPSGRLILCLEACSAEFTERQQRLARESASANLHILPGPGADDIPAVLGGLV